MTQVVHFAASLGDLIAVAALALAWMTFRVGRAATVRGQVRAARALLEGLAETFFSGVGALYFSKDYDEQAAIARACERKREPDQVFVFPPEPIAALVADQRAVADGLISTQTMTYGTIALWQINKINELVRKQGVFNAVHGPDFVDPSISAERRDAVATSSLRLSVKLHRDGIGDAHTSWFQPLKASVEKDLPCSPHVPLPTLSCGAMRSRSLVILSSSRALRP